MTSGSNSGFYLKKLQTEAFGCVALRGELGRVGEKMEQEIQAVKRRLRVKNLKMFRAQEKLRTIEDHAQQARDALRTTIHQQLLHSQNKLESLVLNKQTRSRSREQLRQTTLLRIKSMDQTAKEQSFRKSQQLSKDSETFLLHRASKTPSKTSLQSHSRASLNTTSRALFESAEQGQEESVGEKERRRVLPGVLRVSEGQIRARQAKRDQLAAGKEARNLQECVEKLGNIEAHRQHRKDRLSDTVKLIEKERKAEQERYASRKRAESLAEDRVSKHSISPTKQAIKNKYSFSELYTKKLEEKLAHKAEVQEEGLREGDAVMRREGQFRSRKREERLIRDSCGEVQRRINFRYMERFRR